MVKIFVIVIWAVLFVSPTFPQTMVDAQVEIIRYGEIVSAYLEQNNIDQWRFEGTEGDIVSIAMGSSDFDTFLELLTPSLTTLVSDDNSGKNSNSLIRDIHLTETGLYTILSSAADDGTGNYTLEIISHHNSMTNAQCEGFENIHFVDYDLSGALNLPQLAAIFDDDSDAAQDNNIGIRYPLDWPPPWSNSFGRAGLRNQETLSVPIQPGELLIGFTRYDTYGTVCETLQAMYEYADELASMGQSAGLSEDNIQSYRLGNNLAFLTYFEVTVPTNRFMGYLEVFVEVEGTMIHIHVENYPEFLAQWNSTILAIAASMTKDFALPELGISVQARVHVTDDGLSLRKSPGTHNERIEKMPAGTIVTIIGGPITAGGYIWWEVRSPSGNDGWAVEAADGIQTLVPLPHD